MVRIRMMFTVACMLAAVEASCGPQIIDGRVEPGSIGSFFKTVCLIHYRTGPLPYIGPDGRAVPLTAAECEEKNREEEVAAQEAEQEAEQARATQQALAAQQAQAEQQRRAAADTQIVREEEARGYKQVTLKDLLLDSKVYAANETKVSVSGFYHAQSRQNERLYNSYSDYMMHKLNPSAFGNVEALNVALITEDGSRTLREYLLRCVAGCGVTILGHVGQCVETNAFGRTSHDFCLVAEDMRAVEQ